MSVIRPLPIIINIPSDGYILPATSVLQGQTYFNTAGNYPLILPKGFAVDLFNLLPQTQRVLGSTISCSFNIIPGSWSPYLQINDPNILTTNCQSASGGAKLIGCTINFVLTNIKPIQWSLFDSGAYYITY